MKLSLTMFALLFAAVCAYDFTMSGNQPSSGVQLEETLRSELDDIWVV